MPLLVDRQTSPLLEDAHVLAGQRPAREGIVGAVLSSRRLFGGGGMALEVVEGAAAAIFVLDRSLVVVPMRQVRVAGGVHFSVAVGLDLDALDSGALVVAGLAFDRHVGHCWVK